jgi:hypothetical protein
MSGCPLNCWSIVVDVFVTALPLYSSPSGMSRYGAHLKFGYASNVEKYKVSIINTGNARYMRAQGYNILELQSCTLDMLNENKIMTRPDTISTTGAIFF